MKTSKTNRIFHYHVNITFKGAGLTERIGRVTSGYSGSLHYQDTFVFYMKSCDIVMARSRAYADGAILSNASNTVNAQIIKALLCYYAVSSGFPEIDKISIIRKQSGKSDYSYKECSTFVQPIIGNAFRSMAFKKDVVDILMADSLKGQSLRIAMTYWLKGIASNDEYYKFDHLWRSFNRIFMYHGNNTKEFECLRTMRQFILINSSSFPKTVSVTNNYTKDEFHSFRWARMILNDYDTREKNQALVDFVCRYHDSRIMDLFEEKLACRKDFLQEDKNGLFKIVEHHIKSNKGVIADSELVTMLSIKYAYFIRNKIFHGEMADGSFKVKPNNIDVEMGKLNKLLETLVFELVENYKLLRD